MPMMTTTTSSTATPPDNYRRRIIRLALLSEARERFASEQQKLLMNGPAASCHDWEEGSVDGEGGGAHPPTSPRPLLVAPISPTPQSLIASVLPTLGLTDLSLLIDVGCGDGRWMIAAASETGCRCVGCDVDDGRLAVARGEVERLGLTDRVDLRHVDAFEFVLSARRDDDDGGRLLVEEADVVVLYLFREAMRRMSTILTEILLGGGERRGDGGPTADGEDGGSAEGAPLNGKSDGTTIVCVGFALPNWRPAWQRAFDGIRVHVYSTSRSQPPNPKTHVI